MTKVTKRPIYPALENSKSVQNPDLLNIADKNYTSTILKYSNLAILYSQLNTNAKTVVGAINELEARPTEIPPAKKAGTTDKLGGIFVGEGLDVTDEGTLFATGLVGPATRDKLGGIKVGEYLNITSDGTLSVDNSAVGTYTGGKLINISDTNVIGVNMEESTIQDIEQESRDNPNVLFFTPGVPATDNDIHVLTIVLVSSDWEDNTQVISLSPITQYSNIIVAANPDNIESYTDYGIYASDQAIGSVTFKCRTTPELDVRVNIAYWG